MTSLAAAGLQPLKRAQRRLAAAVRGLTTTSRPDVAAEEIVAQAYDVVLGRTPDPEGLRTFAARLATEPRYTVGALYRDLLSSSEYLGNARAIGLAQALHQGRQQWMRGLPAARRILDPGGSSQCDPRGALLSMGYPYDFDELVIVDLPAHESHALYGANKHLTDVETAQGPVTYRFHSMTDLSAYGDARFDLFVSGQSIEHIDAVQGLAFLRAAYRVLAPGGWLALDTPNGPACRLHMPHALINPDHKLEYAHDELRRLIVAAGFEVVEAKGIGHMRDAITTGVWNEDEICRKPGVYADAEHGYLLAFLARKPA